jgi:hypothetical protein
VGTGARWCCQTRMCTLCHVCWHAPPPPCSHRPVKRKCIPNLLPVFHMHVNEFRAVLEAYRLEPGRVIVNIANNHACVPLV